MLARGELRFWTDFNTVRDDGLLSALIGAGGGSDRTPEVGEVIRLFDGDGNTCFGVVTRVDDDLVYAEPDWRTWRGAHVEISPVTDLLDALRESVREAQSVESETTGYDRVVFDVRTVA